MDSVLRSLIEIVNSKIVLCPEQSIQMLLTGPKIEFPSNLQNDQIQKYEKIFLGLLQVNNGELSASCSIQIATVLLQLYKLESNSHFWNLITLTTDSPTPANIYAIGYIVGKIGVHSKSSLGNLTLQLLNLKDTHLHYPALIALRKLFKVCGSSLSKNAMSAFNFAKNYVNQDNEIFQIAALRLLQVLINFKNIESKKMIKVAQISFERSQSFFTNLITGEFVAMLAIYPHFKDTSRRRMSLDDVDPSDFSIKRKHKKSSALENSFQVLTLFKPQLSIIMGRFLDLLEPQFIHQNVKVILHFIVANCPQEIPKLTAFFAGDVRHVLYETIFKANHPNFNLLKTLTYDAETARDTAGLGYERICGKVNKDTQEVAKYYVALTVTYPDVALESLHAAVHYLAMPPDGSTNLVREYEGLSSIAAIILATLNDETMIPDRDKPLFKKFIDLAFKEHPTDPMYLTCGFHVLAALPDDYAIPALVNPAMDHVFKLALEQLALEEKQRKYPMNLISSVLIFLSSHSNFPIAKQFAELCYTISYHLNQVGLHALLRLFIQIDYPVSMLISISIFYIHKLGNLGLSLKYVKERIPLIMKIPEEVFTKTLKPVVDKSNLLFFIDNALLSTKICDNLPHLFVRLGDNERRIFLKQLSQLENMMTSMMGILSLYQDEEAIKLIPEELLLLLLETMNTHDNIIRLQITAECIAFHMTQYPRSVGQVMNYINSNDSISSVFIETSMTRHVNLSDQALADILVRNTTRILNPKLTRYVLNGMASLYDTKSVQLVSMMIGEQQLQQLITLIQKPFVLNPFTLYLISICLEKLVPILLPILDSDVTMKMISLCLISFKFSMIPFSKIFFYNMFRSISAFSKNIKDVFIIKLPSKEIATIELKLAACGALADLAKNNPIQEDLIDWIPSLFVLLQRTKDKRATKVITEIARSYVKIKERRTKENMIEWFKICKQVLSTNILPGFGSSTVEPNTAVKAGALSILNTILKLLVKIKPLQTECLDDMMTSTIRAIETTRLDLHKIAYPLLKHILEKFKTVHTEETNSRLLELYESQFFIAIRFAFPSSVDLSADFINAYLDFYFEDYENNPKVFMILIQNIINGLTSVKAHTSGFYSISSKICMIAQASPSIFEEVKGFVSSLTNIFYSLILDSITIRTTDVNWTQVSKFRTAISPFYHDLLSSFVWLSKVYPSDEFDLNYEALSSFFLMELLNSSESWRTYAALGGLNTILHYYGNILSIEIVNLIMTSACDLIRKQEHLLSPLVFDFVEYSSILIPPNSPQWKSLAYVTVHHKCSAASLIRIMTNVEQEFVCNATMEFAQFIISELKQKILTEEESIAFFTYLLHISSYTPNFISLICNSHLNDFPKFQLVILKRCLLIEQTRVSIDKVAKIFCRNFLIGGVEAVSQLAVKFPTFGLELIKRGAFTTSLRLILEDCKSVQTILYFLDLSLRLLKGEQEFVIREIAKAAMHSIRLYGNQETVSLAITLLRKTELVKKGITEQAYDELSDDDKYDLIKSLTKLSKVRKPVQRLALRKFSHNSLSVARRSRGEEEWQTLDDDLD